MKKYLLTLITFATAFLVAMAIFPANANASSSRAKEWTFLIFLNGHNNLDSYGLMNMLQMEEVGSNDKVNIVVQWASLINHNTKRMLIQKSTDPLKVTSPVIEDLPPVDMGDYKELTKFIKWGAKNFPAKHYFVNIWNHGSGWHRNLGTGFQTLDISYDDTTNNHITTEELALSLEESAKALGHKIDIYGSDACMMAMAEVAGEMATSVDYFVGSEEVEPGEGWPYSTFLKTWLAMPSSSPLEVSKLLSNDYLKAYSGGIYGNKSVTMSAMDLSEMANFNSSLSGLAKNLSSLPAKDLKATLQVADSTMSFTSSDYKDLKDFLNKLSKISSVKPHAQDIKNVISAMDGLVISNDVSTSFSDAHGVAIWLPTTSYDYNEYSKRYQHFKFNQASGWGDFLSKMAGQFD